MAGQQRHEYDSERRAINPDQPYGDDHMPPILRWFTFHEGRHTHTTWLTEDGIPEIARHQIGRHLITQTPSS